MSLKGQGIGRSVWWNWTPPLSASYTLLTSGSGFPTVLAIYTGSSVSALTPVASDVSSGGCGKSWIYLVATAGTTYRIAVDGVNGAQGTVDLTVSAYHLPDPAVPVRFDRSSVRRSSPQFSVTVTGPASAPVQIDTSPDLENWSSYASFTLGTGGSYAYTDTAATTPIRFYRASYGSSRSCNIVGYADVTVRQGTSLISNPFNLDGVNHISEVLPGVPLNTTLSKWRDTQQDWVTSTFATPPTLPSSPPGGGGAWSDPNMTLPPGEGAKIYTPSAFVKTFVGEVVQGYATNSIPNLSSLRSSIVPQAGRVVTDLALPVRSGESVKRMINGVETTYTYNGGAWSPAEPAVSIGESFWNIKSGVLRWDRNFLVWHIWP
jgi:hypothetical protein